MVEAEALRYRCNLERFGAPSWSCRILILVLALLVAGTGPIIVIEPAFGENPANRKVAEIVDALRLAGDRRLYELQLPKLELTGCDFHPNLSDHRLMSAALVKFSEDHVGEEPRWTPSSRHSQSHGN